MKQTANYQLNLIEPDDAFSPDPLNENAEKTDVALTGLNAEFSARIADVAAAMGSGGSTARIAYGSYFGQGRSGSAQKVSLTFEFRPMLVVDTHVDGSHGLVLVRGAFESYTTGNATASVSWGSNSVSYYSDNTSGQLDEENEQYVYVAMGV